MSPKHDDNSKVKRVRKTITMAVKCKIIKLKDRGCTTSSIGRELNLSRTTVQTILKDREKLQTALPSISLNSTIIRKRNTLICEMEKLLYTWIQNHTRRRVPLSLAIIQSKALSIISTLQNKSGKNNNEATKSFSASRGWFMRFKTRYSLHNVLVQRGAAGAGRVAAQSCPGTLKRISKSGDHSPKIVNVDETGLFWNKMPSRTVISQEEKYIPELKAPKDCLTLLLGSNAEVTADDIDLFCSHSQELTNEISEEIGPIVKTENELTLKKLSEAFASLENAMKIFEENDPNFERSYNVNNKICAAYQCYLDLYDKKKKDAKQPRIDSFFKLKV